jgi:hypothetical protein
VAFSSSAIFRLPPSAGELLRLERELTPFFDFFLGFLALGQVAGDLGKADNSSRWVADRIDDDVGPKALLLSFDERNTSKRF